MGLDHGELDAILREARRISLATLTRLLGPANLALAEDAVQDAILEGLDHWVHDGVPGNPSAWLTTVARRKALDAIRREKRQASDEQRATSNETALELAATDDPDAHEDIADNELRLLFLCCHPAIAADSRVALTLKVAGGFDTDEIARAFLADESAVAQRIVRAKRTFRELQLPYTLPSKDELSARLGSVLDVCYLMFNEGHTAHRGEALLRRDLCQEAIRLISLIADRPDLAEPRVWALLALFLFQAARLPARIDADGALVRLPQQDRARWDHAMISEALGCLDRSARGDDESVYHIEAEIACCHAIAPSWEATDWDRIVGGYDKLLAIWPSPIVALNRAVALAERDGAEVGLAALDKLQGQSALQRYHLYYGTRGELLARLGRTDEARAAFEESRKYVQHSVVQGFVELRLRELSAPA
jgi:RNA polymerase sigma-70 factor (ECF subfamily)